ncbi:MAG: hypothetical protein DWH79_03310 [Planctomycetota bacterium]|nr:MAG: hypothetical protein DWH79_03310 [Planctomycetota bacterium]
MVHGMTRRCRGVAWGAVVLFAALPCLADQSWPTVAAVDRQPLLAQVNRLVDALERLGSPLSPEARERLGELQSSVDDAAVTRGIETILDPLCAVAIGVAKDGPPTVVVRDAGEPLALVEQGWRTLLVKVLNTPAIRARLRVGSPQARPLPHAPAADVADRFLALSAFEGQPFTPTLSGLSLEYRIVELWASSAGDRTATLEFSTPPTDGVVASPGTTSIVAAWRFTDGCAGWDSITNQVSLQARDGSLFVEGTGNDPFLGATFSAPSKPAGLVLRFWAKAEEAGIGQVFWWTEERPRPDGGHAVTFNVEPGREMLYEIPIPADGHVVGVRIDPNGKPCRMRIDWIEVASADRGSEWAGAEMACRIAPSNEVTFRVEDEPGLPAVGCFEVVDEQGRVFPPQSKRLAPDFFFQRQIYREDGETMRLPAGTYTVRCSRGPESVPEIQSLVVGEGPAEVHYTVRRWVDPVRHGYWSGDHHIHAAGCAHYESPTEGVMPADMLRHCMGEDLKVGCCLTWGPCFDFQKRFFSGKPDDVSRPPFLLRYDIEVSGFGSHASGHLNLLRLTEQIPPGGDSKQHWPTLGLNTLRWAKRQGAVCGPAHSASGLLRVVGRVPGTEGRDGPGGLPTFDIPAFDGIGANEFIMDVAHVVPGREGRPVPAVDFLSMMNTDRRAEWNIWYHVLNCGLTVRASGETDFPCMTGERVGIGRVYARLDGPLDFDAWCDAIAAGRSYVSDGRTHLMEFSALTGGVSPLEIGTRESTLALRGPADVTFRAIVAGRPADGLAGAATATLPVELVVNGFPVERIELPADGRERSVEFTHRVEVSSWAAIRVFPGAHTNPVFIPVAGAPIRPDRDSARWCLACVEQCWREKAVTYTGEERETAEADYAGAREFFSRRAE